MCLYYALGLGGHATSTLNSGKSCRIRIKLLEILAVAVPLTVERILLGVCLQTWVRYPGDARSGCPIAIRLASFLESSAMKIEALWIPLLLLPLVGCDVAALGEMGGAQEREQQVEAKIDPAQKAAISELRKLRGRCQLDDNKSVIDVDLRGPAVTDGSLAHLRPFAHLQRLKISQARVTDAGLMHLEGLSNVRFLTLRMTNVTDAGMVHLRGMTKMVGLHLPGARIGDAALENFKGMSQLARLDLRRTQISDAGLEHLRELTKLTYVNLDRTKVTGAGFQFLTGLTNLKDLSLYRTNVDDSGLEHLSGLRNIETLILMETKITDLGLQRLNGLTGLELLDVAKCDVTDAGVEQLQRALPNCKILHGG